MIFTSGSIDEATESKKEPFNKSSVESHFLRLNIQMVLQQVVSIFLFLSSLNMFWQ